MFRRRFVRKYGFDLFDHELVVLSPRKRLISQVGLDGSKPTSLSNERFRDVPPRMRMSSMQRKFLTLTPENLLGPLNDVEEKYVPKEIFAAGRMEIPLPRPRVAIVGSRKASMTGLTAAADIAKTLNKKGVVIVSGLAKGVDTAAHTAVIDVGGGVRLESLGLP